MPKNLLIKVALLEPVYQETRYPDVSSQLPAEEFDEKDAIELVNNAQEVLEWVKKKIR
jgi:HEPN domain-containing protein